MKSVLLLFIALAAFQLVMAQKVTIPEIVNMLEMPATSVDTLMKKKGYRLMEKEADSASTMYYYSNLERNEDAPSWVRSLSYMEAVSGEFKGRMVNYRTYNRNEYQELMSFLLNSGFKTVKSFEIEKARHTIFSNGKQTITVKLKNNSMNNGKWIRSYEFEMGK
jgi:hypothetical protein